MTKYEQIEFEDESGGTVGSAVLKSRNTGISATRQKQQWSTALWCSGGKTAVELFLSVICVSLATLVITLLIMGRQGDRIGLQISQITSNTDDGSYCVTAHCRGVAASIINSINPSADPCDDFYEYACGGWIERNPVPAGRSVWGILEKMDQDTELVIKNILENPFFKMKSKAEETAKIYYLTCMDLNNTLETLDSQPMLTLLDAIGGWNITGTFNVSNWSLQNSMHILHNVYGMSGLFSRSVGEDCGNGTRHTIQIDRGGITLLTTDNYLNKTEYDRQLAAYLDYMTKIGVLLGGDERETRRQMQAVIDFETKLAGITLYEEIFDEEKLYHLMSIGELQELAPFMSWLDYFQNLTEIVNQRISSQFQITNLAPEYFKQLTELIQEYNGTADGKIVLNNYLVWQTVNSLTAFLSRPFREASRGLVNTLIGVNEYEEQWRYCIDDTNNVMGLAVGAMFEREVLRGKSKLKAGEMINEICETFVKNLPKFDWMDAETRELVEERAKTITGMIGFSDLELNPEELDEHYKELTIKEKEYFFNHIRVNKYRLKKSLEKLEQMVNKTTDVYSAATENQIVLAADVLRNPFYDVENANSLNFGGIGVVIGRQLIHIFDDHDENLADNGGLKVAYYTYLSSVKNHQDQLLLPGLNLTHRQLFFLNFAQVWCSATTTKPTALQMEEALYTPSNYRVIGPLMNFPEFSVEFKCPRGSRMNPIDKCEVW